MSFFFSFIVPVYNSDKTITKSLKSTFGKASNKNEIVVVDDKSKDKSLKKIYKLKKNSKRNIKIIKNKINKGPGASRNKGIMKAKGRYLIFLDSDDKIIENSLEKVKKEIEKNKFPDLILGLYKKENFPFSNKIYFNKIRKRSFIKKRNFLKNLYQRQLTLDECCRLS